ncbi:hypothetical protein BS629_32645 [Rhizobium leguminosarum bv. viciae USDA 2370]|nr:hypothetical protein CHR56_10005 [Rhizobium leguminosarum bv. viciae]OOO42498.1 hypothetical protein BS629_32645 [Rhizobium leguminosarum bv. viciae USDA 2370]
MSAAIGRRNGIRRRPVQISRCLCRQPLEFTTTARHCSSRPEAFTAPADSGRAGGPCRPSR